MLGETLRRTTEHRASTSPLARPVESTTGRSVLHHLATALRRPSRRDSRIASSLAEGRPPLNNRAHLGSIRPSLFILRSPDVLLTTATQRLPFPPAGLHRVTRGLGLPLAQRFSTVASIGDSNSRT